MDDYNSTITDGISSDQIEAIMHEGAGKDRKTLLAWLNDQVDVCEAEPGYVPHVKGIDDDAPTKSPATPIYRPEKRANTWMILDVANGVMRQEIFENKGDARAFIGRLEQLPDGVDLAEPYFHKASE